MLQGRVLTTSDDPAVQEKLDRTRLGRRLASIRKGADLNQEEMGHLLGVDQATVCRWERGEWKSKSLLPAQLLAYAFLQGCPVSTLTARALSDDDRRFEIRKRTPEEVTRCRAAMSALGLLGPHEQRLNGELHQECALVQALFALLNEQHLPTEKVFAIDGYRVEPVQVGSDDQIGIQDFHALKRAMVVVWKPR